MCRIFAGVPPEGYALETRSIRLNGQGTSIRLERVFWAILDRIAAGEGLSLPRFLSVLHAEILEIRGEPPNFTSHLRCLCVLFLERGGSDALRSDDGPSATRGAPGNGDGEAASDVSSR
ncbi:ribbon-helix-helix domain-containing protein [Segnochrobactrum spirostomi]|uniref:Ribbon-helix-helix domain-containing protein n=1 Tax=Segnochrobactrum spirostomi TaxID=2608987 RepID=A0A6A7YAV9_9HYPH|nr:ribbon-helix-helix domain-containing protein [Segnochrobactrum spirostomi]MQT14802.1 ribbon-helix-helix domain-containing protein [Segnochrobactrum spirostomi]